MLTVPQVPPTITAKGARRVAFALALLAGCGGGGAAGGTTAVESAGDSGRADAEPDHDEPADAAEEGDAAVPPDASDGRQDTPDAPEDTADGAPGARGFPPAGDWVSFYGPAAGVDLGAVAAAFRVINVDADPDGGNFTDAEIATLRAGGQNRVISYLDIGSCESFRSYYQAAPKGHASCVSSGALTTDYDGYPDEKWADLSNLGYRELIVGWVAPRLWARGVDGFFLDNLEVVEHGASASNGPCDSACAQGGLDLVWELRQAFPDALIVMQNGTSDVTRLGASHGAAFPSLLDGISHEEVYGTGDGAARDELLAWKSMSLTVGGRPFWIATEDYVGACDASAKGDAATLLAASAADGFHGYVTDASGSQLAPCLWSQFP